MRLGRALNGNGTVTGNGDLKENGGRRSRENSGGKLNGSGSDDQINEHFYDVPEVSFASFFHLSLIRQFSLLEIHKFTFTFRARTTWRSTRRSTERERRRRR